MDLIKLKCFLVIVFSLHVDVIVNYCKLMYNYYYIVFIKLKPKLNCCTVVVVVVGNKSKFINNI